MIFFIISQQLNETILCYKTILYCLQPSRTVLVTPLSYSLKTLAKFVYGQNDKNKTMITFLLLMILSFLLFEMMSGSESQASECG